MLNRVFNAYLEHMLLIVIDKFFKINIERALKAINKYSPTEQRSQLLIRDGIHFVIDCYNANPTSMILSLESFVRSAVEPRGIILGDMLELGSYADEEHERIINFVNRQKLDTVVLIGKQFKQALNEKSFKNFWFVIKLHKQIRKLIVPSL